MRYGVFFLAGLVVGVALVIAAGEWFTLRRAHRGDAWMRDIDRAQLVKRILS